MYLLSAHSFLVQYVYTHVGNMLLGSLLPSYLEPVYIPMST